MKFMVIIKADSASEAGRMPSMQLIEEMGRFNEALMKAGVLLAGEGLQPSSKGARVKISGTQRTVTHGPFPTEGLVSGFWLLELKSLDEAIEWVKRCPRPHEGDAEPEIEIRQLYSAADFEGIAPETMEAEARMREQLAARG